MKEGYKIIVTGHSLGGNVAENLLMDNQEIVHCESFNAGNTINILEDTLDDLFDS